MRRLTASGQVWKADPHSPRESSKVTASCFVAANRTFPQMCVLRIHIFKVQLNNTGGEVLQSCPWESNPTNPPAGEHGCRRMPFTTCANSCSDKREDKYVRVLSHGDVVPVRVLFDSRSSSSHPVRSDVRRKVAMGWGGGCADSCGHCAHHFVTI